MAPELWWRAAGAALAVGLTLALLRRAGARAAGLAAALPVSSVPALHLLWWSRGAGSASAAAFGALWGTGMVALLALAAVAWARRRAVTGGSATHAPTGLASPAWRTMALAAGMSVLVSELAAHVGAQWCGLVAATPLVVGCTLCDGWRRHGSAVLLPVLAGYLDGLVPKAACLAALGLAWQRGWDLAAWPAAVAAGLLAWNLWRLRSAMPLPRGAR